MSFWMGMARAFKDADTKKTEDRRIVEERAYDSQVRDDARKFEEKMFWDKVAEDRRTALLEATAKRRASSTKDVNPADLYALGARLRGAEGSEDLMAAAVQDPTLATSILETIRDAEEKSAAKGYNRYITGEELVSNFQIYGVEGMLTEGITTEDIMDADLTDPEVFGTLTEQAAAERGPQYTFDYKPDLYYVPDTSREEYGAEVFDNVVGRLAKQEIDRLAAVDEAAAGDLAYKFSLYGKPEGAAETEEIRSMFRDQAIEVLEGFMSTQGTENNPNLAPLPEPPPTVEADPTGVPEASVVETPQVVQSVQETVDRYMSGEPVLVTPELAKLYPSLADKVGKSVQRRTK